MAWQWQLLLLAREPLFPGRAPGVLICPILLLNPVISCRTGCLVEREGPWGEAASQLWQMSPDCSVFFFLGSLSPEALVSETQHCTVGHSLTWMSGIHRLPESTGSPSMAEQKCLRRHHIAEYIWLICESDQGICHSMWLESSQKF